MDRMRDAMGEQTGGEGDVRARRRRWVPGGRRRRHTVRFDDDEQQRVVAEAGRVEVSLPHLVAETMLAALDAPGSAMTPAQQRHLVEELFTVQEQMSAIDAKLAAGGCSAALERAAFAVLARLDAVLVSLEADTGRAGRSR